MIFLLIISVPPIVGSTSSYPLRNANDLQIIHANSQLYYNSFLPSAVREWNELPEQTRNSSSLNIFKTRNINLPPSYYFTGKTICQIYHARLRTKCSSLRQHLFSKNLIDSPRCACGSVEDNLHFLLVCDQYTDLRRELLTTVSDKCNPTLDVVVVLRFYGPVNPMGSCRARSVYLTTRLLGSLVL